MKHCSDCGEPATKCVLFLDGYRTFVCDVCISDINPEHILECTTLTADNKWDNELHSDELWDGEDIHYDDMYEKYAHDEI